MDLAERLLRAFLVQMLRTEAVDSDDIAEAADSLERGGDGEAAHAMRCLIIEANTPEASNWNADKARARFHAIEGGKSPE